MAKNPIKIMSGSKNSDIIPTRAMLLKKNSQNTDFKVIKFTEKKSKPNTIKYNNKTEEKKINETRAKPEVSDDDEYNDDEDIFDDAPTSKRRNFTRDDAANSNEFDMKRARYDVINFGVSGYGTKDNTKSKIALAIKLVAKPPKNEYKNYKVLIEERKQAKIKESEADAFLNAGKNQYGAPKGNFRKSHKKFVKNKKKQSGMLDLYGVVNPKGGKTK